MTETANPHQAALRETSRRVHPHCVACGAAHPFGLHVEFIASPDGSVTATLASRRVFEGYNGLLHGGVVSTLLDAAMTHCLFARGRTAVTGELTVRFRSPVRVDHDVTVRAWLRRGNPPLYLMAAELIQQDQVKATARAKFMEQPEVRRPTNPTT